MEARREGDNNNKSEEGCMRVMLWEYVYYCMHLGNVVTKMSNIRLLLGMKLDPHVIIASVLLGCNRNELELSQSCRDGIHEGILIRE